MLAQFVAILTYSMQSLWLYLLGIPADFLLQIDRQILRDQQSPKDVAERISQEYSHSRLPSWLWSIGEQVSVALVPPDTEVGGHKWEPRHKPTCPGAADLLKECQHQETVLEGLVLGQLAAVRE